MRFQEISKYLHLHYYLHRTKNAMEITKNLCLAENSLNFELISSLIKKRENLCSTALDNHIAIPHAKVPGINKIYASLSIHRKGMSFGSIDNKDTNIFILLLLIN